MSGVYWLVSDRVTGLPGAVTPLRHLLDSEIGVHYHIGYLRPETVREVTAGARPYKLTVVNFRDAPLDREHYLYAGIRRMVLWQPLHLHGDAIGYHAKEIHDLMDAAIIQRALELGHEPDFVTGWDDETVLGDDGELRLVVGRVGPYADVAVLVRGSAADVGRVAGLIAGDEVRTDVLSLDADEDRREWLRTDLRRFFRSVSGTSFSLGAWTPQAMAEVLSDPERYGLALVNCAPLREPAADPTLKLLLDRLGRCPGRFPITVLGRDAGRIGKAIVERARVAGLSLRLLVREVGSPRAHGRRCIPETCVCEQAILVRGTSEDICDVTAAVVAELVSKEFASRFGPTSDP